MYSQNDEEKVILEIAARRGIKDGKLLDIGAYDGRTFSNSLALIEQGWGGVLVEPSFQAFKALADLHSGRPGIELVNALIEPNKHYLDQGLGLRKFWSSPDAVATSDPDHMKKWQGAGQYQPIWVGGVNVIQLMKQFPGPFNFVNIDCEGKATLGIFLDMLAPAVPFVKPFGGAEIVCVEFDNHRSVMTGNMQVAGYKLAHTTGENLIFERA